MTKIKITGIKKAVGEYNRTNKGGYYSPRYGRLMLDRESGEVWTDEFYSIGHGDRKQYSNPAIINLGNIIAENREEITMKTVKMFAIMECAGYNNN